MLDFEQIIILVIKLDNKYDLGKKLNWSGNFEFKDFYTN